MAAQIIFTGLAKAAVMPFVALPTSAITNYEGAQRAYSNVVNFLLNRYVTEGNIVTIKDEVCRLNLGTSLMTIIAQ